ncbi:MAG: HEPN domain-containing protein, partial [Nitrospirales bacterium]
WACFAAQQAAEKAVKAVYEAHHLEGWGHTISILLGNLTGPLKAPEDIITRAKALDKHYIPTRYPNGFESGAPTDFYTAAEADQAIAHAKSVLDFCRTHLPSPPGA